MAYLATKPPIGLMNPYGRAPSFPPPKGEHISPSLIYRESPSLASFLPLANNLHGLLHRNCDRDPEPPDVDTALQVNYPVVEADINSSPS